MDGNSWGGRTKRIQDVIRRLGWFASGMTVLSACLLVRSYWPADSASRPASASPTQPVRRVNHTETAKSPAMKAAPNAAVAPKKLAVVAVVNNEPISREDLARVPLALRPGSAGKPRQSHADSHQLQTRNIVVDGQGDRGGNRPHGPQVLGAARTSG